MFTQKQDTKIFLVLFIVHLTRKMLCNKGMIDWRSDSGRRALALQVQSPKFKLQFYPKTKPREL
jgi:hypothetical protein